jgi:hypothetical protein
MIPLALDIYQQLMAEEPPHGLLALPTLEECAQILTHEDGTERLTHFLAERRRAVALSEQEPLQGEPAPDLWALADQVLANGRAGATLPILLLILLGGNRSTKSRYCGRTLMRDAVQYANSMMVCLAEDEMTSQQTQQEILWYYLPREWKSLNGRRSTQFYVKYSAATGFAERRLILPNGTKIFFKTYNEEANEVEGWEFGNRRALVTGWWADENLRLPWLLMFRRRGRFRPSIGLWSYTPINGMTPTIKEAIGDGKVLEWQDAKLLSESVNVPGGPRGKMPLVQQGSNPNWRVLYFATERSPFGSGPNGSRDIDGKTYFDRVAEDCHGKPTDYIKRIAYGYCTDVVGRRFPSFGMVNVIKPYDLPADGTNYLITDPHGDRPWATIWVRVATGNPRRFFIYREWPDLPTYGEWAVPTSRATTQDSRKGWDGDMGPAQRNLGFAFWRYKTLWLDLERIWPKQDTLGFWLDEDPMHRGLLNQMMEEAGAKPVGDSDRLKWLPDDVTRVVKEREEGPMREPVRARYADPRAAANPQANEKGGRNLIQMFGEAQRDDSGRVIADRMLLLPAYSGKGIDDGCGHVNDLLDYDESSEVLPLINEPRLFVVESCWQFRWAMTNYTGQAGEDGACKDFVDLARYMAQTDLRHVSGEGRLPVTGHRQGPV